MTGKSGHNQVKWPHVASRPIQGLGLCSGVGGLELAMGLVYGSQYRCVGHVERETYAAATLVARMAETSLDSAPIWDDVDTFPSELFRGVVDLVTAGFPCQPFSTAGVGAGKDDERWLWPAIADHIGVVGPEIVFLENVPGLRQHGLSEVLSDLAALGFDAEWAHIGARDVGAPHKRERIFVLAALPGAFGQEVVVADADGPGRGDVGQPKRSESFIDGCGDPASAFPPGPDDYEGWANYFGALPGVQRSPYGSAAGLVGRDRLRVVGNGVVPVVAAYAYVALARRFAVPHSE